MRLNRLLASLIGVTGACLVTLPAKGARLQTWQFDTSQNRLTFTTEVGVQPQAKLLANPNRLVIDLPGIAYDQPAAQKLVGGAVHSVRVHQHGTAATRLEMELSPDYPVSPQDIRVWGITPQQWVIQLPNRHGLLHSLGPFPPSLRPGRHQSVTASTGPQLPDFMETTVRTSIPPKDTPASTVPFRVAEPSPNKQLNTAYQSTAATQLEQIVATPQGFFLQTIGPNPPVQIYRTRDRNANPQIVIDLLNTTVRDASVTSGLPSNHLGSGWSITQYPTTPPAVRLTLSLSPNSSDWQVSALGQGGLVVMPAGSTVTGTQAVARTATAAPQLPPITSPTAASTRPQAAPTRLGQERVTVVLDPGHGGVDPGAVGIGGLQEKEVVMAITRHAAAALEAAGVAVIFTRQGDQSVDLQPRVDIAEAAQADLFVSIHANAISMARPEVNGVETYYYSERGARLAQILHRQVMQRINLGDRGVKQARFFVLRRTSMPAVLIETGFVTGAIDAPYLSDPSWQTTMGEAIAEGILTYLRQN